jgi:bifunctional non-homologous end joining protein LigD
MECAKTALILKDLLANLKLLSVVKTSGKKGLHVYVPLNSNKTTFDETKNFSKAIAVAMQNNYPSLVTSVMAKPKRDKKVFINWSQNDASKTMAAVYSLRAADEPTVSCPLSWKELKTLYEKHDPDKLKVTHVQALDRSEKNGDLFAAMLDKKQRLPYL